MSSYVLYIATAFALVFVIEGMTYALFPESIKRMMRMAIAAEPKTMRLFGLAAAAFGFAIVWILQSF